MEKVKIIYATEKHFSRLRKKERHITELMLKKKISDRHIIIAELNNDIVGWLRFGFFSDMVPFMNSLFIKNEYRQKGIGKKIVQFWEKEMEKEKHKFVMTSIEADKEGQFFYRKMGYRDMGALFFENDVSAEIVLLKKLKK